MLNSCMCTQAQLESPSFQNWAHRLGEATDRLHRKTWEYSFITQALYERGLLQPGRRGLGFAVGKEPLAAFFASCGCEIIATDLATEEAAQVGWTETNQHAASLDVLNERGICPQDEFRRLVSFRFMDMRRLPDDLSDFDFIWSACALEHLGTIRRGQKFIYESLKFLKPGGPAVHTMEFNVSSKFRTIKKGGTVLFRRKDIKRTAKELRRRGCNVKIDFSNGTLSGDRIVDQPPYEGEIHLKLNLWGYVATSFGLIILKEEKP